MKGSEQCYTRGTELYLGFSWDDSRVGAGDAGADVLPRLKKRDMQLIPAEISGRKAAQEPSAYYNNIKIPHQNTSMISPGRSSV